ncbi:hypothetical protein BN8_04943 [Fibrisoma limi BUZ 3]|uniref:Uncharacterized protein n=1 Tax=Fibrisoma limi BUZ 3 TaxID=1185876 RepID=I2GP37_9BACT|nr:GreA/GreB family elongation factor [Fibrisoma limi]CCH55665.1 hypothetical protein BN8_04943 [Fibrisoma limi BUZ 3]
MSDAYTVKLRLFAQCQTYVEQRIETAQKAMEAAQESANSESKSSAGDKYETGRAMAQIERDRHAQQLAEALKVKKELEQLSVEKPVTTVQPGSLVTTSRGAFFLSISAGKITLDGVDYFAISPASPIGSKLLGKAPGDELTFNTVTYRILEIQ